MRLRAYPLTARLGRAFGHVQSWHEQQRLDDLVARGVVDIGRYTYGRPRIDIYRGSEAHVEIGSFCSIGPDVRIITGGVHPDHLVSTFPLRIKMGLPGAYKDGMPATDGDVVIGSDVWIGTDVTILSGVSIGSGAVIASGAVVVSDVAPYEVVGGIPARTLRRRFSEDVVEALLRIRWWEWSDDRIKENIADLTGSDLEAFVDRFDRDASG